MIPADFILEGDNNFPSNRNGAAFIAPSFLTNRVAPPAPGKMPTKISGRPILAFLLSTANILWQANGNSKPIPAAVPVIAAATGLAPFFVLKSIPASSIFLSNL